jgi:hypothetical protein
MLIAQEAVTFETDVKTVCDMQDIRNSIDVEGNAAHTFVVILAVHKHVACNVLTNVSCQTGIPIGGYVYDPTTDCYRASCVAYLRLGIVPVSYRLKIFKNVNSWNTFVPMPESVLIRHMSPTQLEILREFKGTYGEEDYRFEYLQVVVND